MEQMECLITTNGTNRTFDQMYPVVDSIKSKRA